MRRIIRDWKEIQRRHDTGDTFAKLQRDFNISRTAFGNAVRDGLIVRNNYKWHHDEETKKKMSDIKKLFYRENPDKHIWKTNNKLKSVPCEKFKGILNDNNISFTEEYQPLETRFFSIDIAFPEDKFGIEIGS